MTIAASVDNVNNKELAELFVRDLGGADMQPVEQVRLFARSYVGMRNFENIHYQFLSGMLTADEWQGFRQNLKAILEWKSIQTYWANESQYYSAAYQDEVAEIQAELAVDSSDLSHGYVLKSRGVDSD